MKLNLGVKHLLVLLQGLRDAPQNLMISESGPLQLITQPHGLYRLYCRSTDREREGEKDGERRRNRGEDGPNLNKSSFSKNVPLRFAHFTTRTLLMSASALATIV